MLARIFKWFLIKNTVPNHNGYNYFKNQNQNCEFYCNFFHQKSLWSIKSFQVGNSNVAIWTTISKFGLSIFFFFEKSCIFFEILIENTAQGLSPLIWTVTNLTRPGTGEDGIKFGLLKELPLEEKQSLLHIVNDVLAIGDWRLAIQSSFERKQQTLVGFLDISGAYYDNVEPSVAKRNGFFYYEGQPVAESVGFKGLPQGL
jgi:hypothetical protein